MVMIKIMVIKMYGQTYVSARINEQRSTNNHQRFHQIKTLRTLLPMTTYDGEAKSQCQRMTIFDSVSELTLYNQYVNFTINILSGLIAIILFIDLPSSNSPLGSISSRLCVQTRYKAEPGIYSHRNTAFPLNEI